MSAAAAPGRWGKREAAREDGTTVSGAAALPAGPDVWPGTVLYIEPWLSKQQASVMIAHAWDRGSERLNNSPTVAPPARGTHSSPLPSGPVRHQRQWRQLAEVRLGLRQGFHVTVEVVLHFWGGRGAHHQGASHPTLVEITHFREALGSQPRPRGSF